MIFTSLHRKPNWNFGYESVLLVGGLEHFLFFHISGVLIPTDFHIFQRGRLNHQPDLVSHGGSRCSACSGCSAHFTTSDGLAGWASNRLPSGFSMAHLDP